MLLLQTSDYRKDSLDNVSEQVVVLNYLGCDVGYNYDVDIQNVLEK